MRKAIVSGANGFIGSNVVKYLVSQNVEVTALVHAGHDDHSNFAGKNPLHPLKVQAL